MNELEKTALKVKLQHPKEVADIVKALRKIDGFMYGSAYIKTALDQAFSSGGEIGIFMLDCIVADQIATESGIGKVPLTDLEEVVTKSSLIAQFGSIKYIIESLRNKGLDVSLWTFIGDDDFQYSVSPDYSVANPTVKQALSEQTQALKSNLQLEATTLGASAHVDGWLLQEATHPEILQIRDILFSEICAGLNNSTLPDKVKQRFGSFVNWRTTLVSEAGIDPTSLEKLIWQQAAQELTSFVSQGYLAPKVIDKLKPRLPLIFANTFPDVGTQHLDDECIRFGQKLGLSGYQYGTIHLPGPEKLAKFLGEPKDPNFRPMMFSCGEKVKGSGKERWQQKTKI